jgi:peptide chain release factor 1
MFDKKIEKIKQQFLEIETKISDPSIVANQKVYTELTREYSNIKKNIQVYEKLKKIEFALKDIKEMLNDPETEEDFKEVALEEELELIAEKEKLEKELKLYFIPRDKDDAKNTIVEIRAGTGGEEAALFAGDLFRMYSKYAEEQEWKLEILDSSDTGLGGFKEIIFSLEGSDVYKKMRYESGTHRVQRVPDTESSGRIHTSAVTVAVLPEIDEIDIEINQCDLRIDVYRASGPGGQSVNTMDSAVRITHLPTGVVVQCQDGKSQRKNKLQAMKVLRSRLYMNEEEKQAKERSQARKGQIGSGDRSEKIRTYNFPQSRVTDHRIGLSLYKLEQILSGEINEIIEALIEARYSNEISNLSE